MTTLEENDTKLFYRCMNSLLWYVHRRQPLNRVVLEKPDDAFNAGFENIGKLQDMLFGNISLIDDFIKDDPLEMQNGELSVILSWKHFVRGRFTLMRHLKDGSIFMPSSGEETPLYLVKGLFDPLDEKFDPGTIIGATLLPLRHQITYTGILAPYNVYLGRGIMGDLNEQYNASKLQYGIVTSLPFDPNRDRKDDEELLRSYCRSEKNRCEYYREMMTLAEKSDRLRHLYEEETNKFYAKDYKKRYRDRGLKDLYFAMYRAMPIGMAKDERTLGKQVDAVVPKEKRIDVSYFRL